VDAVTDLVAEHVIDEAVLGDAAEAVEYWRGDDSVEVVPVAADIGSGTWNPCLDPLLQFLGCSRHRLKGSDLRSAAILNEA
jgi:hypothetical protein